MIGGGAVGCAVASFFDGAPVYDKHKEMDPVEAVLGQQVIFVCVPTPYDSGFDRSMLDDVFSCVGSAGTEKIIVIKSTTLPGTTDYFQNQYPRFKVLFNPEFLTERTAEYDFKHPDKQLVGYTDASKDVAQTVLDMLPAAPFKKLLFARAAELIKYAINTYYATKVIYGNLLYDLSEALELDYEEVRTAFVSDKRIMDSHFDVMHGGYRGYGGKCLPKDVRALRDFAKARGVDASLIEAIEALNERYQKNST